MLENPESLSALEMCRVCPGFLVLSCGLFCLSDAQCTVLEFITLSKMLC